LADELVAKLNAELAQGNTCQDCTVERLIFAEEDKAGYN
jgi:hypothetical protein